MLRAIKRASHAPDEPDLTPEEIEAQRLSDLRREYVEVMGKRPGPTWDEETIRQKMAERDEEEDE